MHLRAIAQVLTLLLLANGAPVMAKKIFGARFSWPLDFGLELSDGRRLFGAAKTIRGTALGIACGWAAAPLIGFTASLGVQIAALAMVGDLLSSFLKRRLNLSPSSQAPGLDHIPESLLPLLACVSPLGLTAADVAVGVAFFLVGGLLISRFLFRIRVRDQPY